MRWRDNTARIWRLQLKSTRLRSPGCCVSDHTYTEVISQAKRKRRQCEDLWRKSGLTVHRQMFTVQRQVVKDLILNSKRQFLASAIREASSSRVLFGVVDKLLRSIRSRLHSAQHLANRFCNFFHKKIVDIRGHLDDIAVHFLPDIPVKPGQSDLTQFSLITPEELLKIIRQSLAKSCALDPMPTSLLLEHTDCFCRLYHQHSKPLAHIWSGPGTAQGGACDFPFQETIPQS